MDRETIDSPQSGPAPAGQSTALWLFLSLVLVLTLLPILYLLELHYLQEPLLLAALWSQGPDRFADFWHYRLLLLQLHRPEFFTARDRFAYPAPCALLFQVLYHLGPWPHASFDVLLWSVEGLSAWLLYRALSRRGMDTLRAGGLVSLLVLTSYPWHFLYDRANIELVVYIFIAGGVWAWLAGREALAAVLWGIAGSLKIYPIILLVLFARRHGWKYLFLGCACFVGVLFASFWYVGPTILIAAKGTIGGVLGFVGHYGGHARVGELVFDHSILGGLKELSMLPVLSGRDLAGVLSRLYEVAAVLVVPPAFLWWRRRMPLLNQLCLLLLAIMLCPPVSYDYTLVYAYLILGIVLCCAVTAWREGNLLPGARLYAVAFAVVCTAETWITFDGLFVNGLMKCVALLVVTSNVLRFPLSLQGRQQIPATQPQQVQGMPAQALAS